jgi:hypothetical protein
MFRRTLLLPVSLFALALICPSAQAGFTVSAGGGNRAASAHFDQQGTNLVVTLTNTSTHDVLVPADVLTAVFFNIAGLPTLTPVSAVLNGGSTVWFDPDGQPAGGVVSGEWAYRSNLSGGGLDQSYSAGISSSGFNLFGASNFPGPDLDDPSAVNGLNYGITSAGDNMATGNSKVTGGEPLIKNSVVFTLSGLAGFTLTEGSIGDVRFQYGTSLGEGHLSSPRPAPAPSTVALLLAGLAGLAGTRLPRLVRSRFRKNAAA